MSTPVYAPTKIHTVSSPVPQTSKLSRSTKLDQETGEQVPSSVHDAIRSRGQPLDTGTRASMKARFGHDFGRVRVHTNEQAASSARTINANAYTMGNDVAFGSGMYAPHTTRGQELLVHELTHVVQAARHPTTSSVIAPAHHPSEQEATYSMRHASLVPSVAPGGMVQRDLLDTGKEAVTKSLEIQQAEMLGEIAFLVSFLDSAQKAIPADAFQQLDQELRQPGNAALFIAGEVAGIVAGALKDLAGTVVGLVELAVKMSPVYQIGSEAYSLFTKGRKGYVDEKKQNYETAKAFLEGMKDFVQSVVHDPNVLIQIGAGLGAEAGTQSGKWFSEKFMKMGPFHKGETIGEVMGYILIEIALLFVGPEELAIRGGALAAKAAEGTKVGRAILATLEKIPVLAKILEARKLLGAGREAANVAEKGITAGEKAATTLEKGVTTGEKVTATAGKEASHITTEAAKAEGAAHVATSTEQKAAQAAKVEEAAADAIEIADQKAVGAEEKAAQSVKQKKKPSSTNKRKSAPRNQPLSKEEQRGKDILEIFEEGQGKASREAMQAETVEQHGMGIADKPGGKAVPEHFDRGNFAHTYAEELIPKEKLPRGLTKEFKIDLPDGGTKRLDRVDKAAGMIYEIKPNTRSEIKAGRQQLELYIEYMNQHYPLKNGKAWEGKVVTYNKQAVKRLLKKGWPKL